MANIQHEEITLGNRHGIANWAVGSLPALTALVVDAADIDKVARVTGLGYYALTAVTPSVVWEKISNEGAASGNSAIQFQDEGSNLGATGTVNSVNFTGAGVTATRTGDSLEVAVAGGGGITPISVNTTINVPIDYPTHEAALAFAASNLYTNNAIMTITLDAGTVVNTQIPLYDADLSNVIVTALGGGVTVDSSAFADPFGGFFPPALFFGVRTKMPTIAGTWAFTSGNAASCAFGVLFGGNLSVGSALAASTITGCGYGIYNRDGDSFLANTNITSANALYTAGGGVTKHYFGTLTGGVTSAGGEIRLSTVTINSTDVAVTLNQHGKIKFSDTCSLTGKIYCDGGHVQGHLQNFTEASGGNSHLVYARGGSTVSLRAQNLTVVGGSSAEFLFLDNASNANISVSSVSGTSTGNVCTLGSGSHSQAQIQGPDATDFTGGYSQTVDVQTADGIIMAS